MAISKLMPNLWVSSDTRRQDVDDETSPLLSQAHRPQGQKVEYVAWLKEMWFLTIASIPVILAYMLQNSLQTVSVLIAGRLSPEALAIAAFSFMFAIASAWLIALGGTSAISTLR